VSLNGLGYLHSVGAFSQFGVPDWKASALLFSKSSSSGNAEGTYNLGVLYLHGKGVDQSPKTAYGLFQEAANAGNVLAHYQLGNMHLQGTSFIPKSCEQSRKHFKAVMSRGRHLAQLHQAKDQFFAGNIAGSLLTYLHLAEMGLGSANHNAGVILRQGSAATRARNVAFLEASRSDAPVLPSAEAEIESHTPQANVLHTLLWRSAHEGSSTAHLHLGDSYYYGIGTKKNPAKAAEHYAVAARGHLAQALFNLGYMHESGELPDSKRDFHMAKRHYDQALQQSPASYFAVRLALLRLNFHWWIEHFWYGTADVPTNTEAANADDDVQTDIIEEPKVTRRQRLQRSGSTLYRLFLGLCDLVDALNPTLLWQFRVDDVVLALALVLSVTLMLLRHAAFVQ